MERHTRQRQAVLDALAGSGRTLSPPEILSLAQQQAPGLNLSTVYRQVKALEEGGELLKVQLPGHPTRFEAVCRPRASAPHGKYLQYAQASWPAGTRLQPQPAIQQPHHHHHFHCLVCDQVVPIHGCPGTMQELAPPGCRVERHDLVLHGYCAACASPVAA